MSATNAARKFWAEFCRENSDVKPDTPFQVWHFGNTPEMTRELCDLVLQNKKRATASLVWAYEHKPEDAPIIGGYSVVTDYAGEPQCVLRTTELRRVSFAEVDAQFAFDEGEGDQSLDYWRTVHWDYFARNCAEVGREPTTEMPVNCERFELLYPKK